mmetsp:Transcript_45260/g.113937  ORF Transcript_45260/g.113937 Transcript_45260/m.113937 type:complete len:746 (-) Transcript_45260:31-2268(-)
MSSPVRVLSLLLLLLLLLVAACSASSQASHSVLFGEQIAPTHKLYGWSPLRTASSISRTSPVHAVFALRQRNVDLLEETFRAVSDPRSPRYGQHLSFSELGQMISPPTEAVDTVVEFLSAHNIKTHEMHINAHRDFIRVDTTVAKMETLLPGARFQPFQHPLRQLRAQSPLLRSLSAFELPAHVAELLDFVYGVSDFPTVRHTAAGSQHSSELVRLRALELSNSVGSKALSADDWFFSPAAGDSAFSVAVAIPLTQDIGAAIQVTYSQGNYTRTTNFDTSHIQPETTAKFSVYNLLVDHVANEPLTVSVTLQFATGSSSKQSYLSELLPGPWITSQVAQQLYGIPKGYMSTNPNNVQSVAEFDGQFYSPDDVNSFTHLMNLVQPPITVVGPNNASVPGGESTLDIEWILTTGLNVSTVFWSVGDGGFLVEWVQQLADDPNPPQVHSVSYGEPEAFMSDNMTNRLNVEFQKLGVRGLTIISTSGDIGVADGFPGLPCSHDHPDFPSSSPFTTSLGATFLARPYASALQPTRDQMPICTGASSVRGIPILCDATAELPCSAGTGQGFTTGGGFSGKFETPWYQTDFVSEYLTEANLPPASFFNSKGRGYNDVAALGSNILIVMDGELASTGGTSASGPIFAGVVSLLNDMRLNTGKPTVGFLNPLLYQVAGDSARYPGAFNQAATGNNNCQETSVNGSPNCCVNGFEAAESVWNPLLGVGTPNFPTLLQASQDAVQTSSSSCTVYDR